MRDVYQPFNRFDDRTANASHNVVFAWQSGHRPLQRGTTYGLDGAFPTKLQPQLLELYRWASSRWHEFLHLPSYLAHAPVAEDPFKRDIRLSPLTRCREGDEDGGGDTGVTTSMTASPTRVALGWGCSPQAAERHPPVRQALVWSSSGPAPERATQQQQIRRTDRGPSTSDGSWDGEAAGEKEDAVAFFNRIYHEDQEAFERESLRQRQQQAARYDRSAKRSIHQISGSQDAAPRPKRSRTLPLPLSLEHGRDPGPGRLGQASQVGRDLPHDDRRYRPLFGHPSDLPTTGAIDSLQAMLDHLRGRISFSNDDNALRARIKLWKLGDRLEEWSTVGCQLCFINDEPGLDHMLDDCTMIGSDTARRLLGWLETLRLDRFGRTYGLCSLCTEDSQVCQEVVVANQICCASTEDKKNHWRQRRDSAAGPDGLCENKLVIRRTIAALCTSDDQILGKALTKFISEKDSVDLTVESQAIEWFERKVPHREVWVPQLLVILDILVAAFDLLRGRRRRDRRADSGHDGSSEGGVGLHCDVPSLEISWDDSNEVAGWKVVIDWWVGKCSFCAGRGVRGPQIEHALRQCPFGGKPTLKMGLAEAIFEEGIWALGGCLGCALPRELCQAWSKSTSGRWKRDLGIRCQYGRQAYDTAIGFFYCKERKYRQELIESMADAGLENFDEEEVASWLGRKITVAGIESSEIMRQLRWWSGILWDKMRE
ncbi:Doublecortin domain-containing protein [Fusarium sp. Ph1]|nr:Doublecortin domain-containing protein [Fusarium sp. Ph1]